MAMKNKYFFRAKISETRFRQILKLFAVDLNASQIAEITGISRNTVNRYLATVRERLHSVCSRETPVGVLEAAEEQRVSGMIFGLFRLDGCVYTEPVPDCFQTVFFDLMNGKIPFADVRSAPWWRGYSALIDLGRQRFLRLEPKLEGLCEHGIGEMESFWSYAKGRLAKFRGVPGQTVEQHLKECEFRFNHRREDVYKLLLKIFRTAPAYSTCQ